jgi:eukaryotic-like serine/threonine-protein kinase
MNLDRLGPELQRRKVWRTAAAYASVALVIALAVAELYDVLLLPDWTPRLVVALLVAGLPIAMALSWAYDVRPESAVPATTGAAAAAAVQVAARTGEAAAEAAREEAVRRGAVVPVPSAAPVPAVARSIVVLPFENLSPDADNEYFSDGLTEEVITDLSQLRSLRVISRTSAMLLKGCGKDVRTIGRELSVRYVLEGSVRKAGDRLRVTAQLIDAATDAHLWAERYDGVLDDVFAIQEGIARAVAAALRLELTGEEDQTLAAVRIPDVRAYDAFLRARHDVWIATRESLERAEQYLASARGLAGDSALLAAATAYVFFQKANFGYAQDEAVEGAERFARRALELDPDCAEAHVVLGACAQAFRGDMLESLRWLERARELSPGDLESVPWFANANLVLGRHEEAVRHARMAVGVDPLTPQNPLILAYALARSGRPAEGLEYARQAHSLAPASPHTFWIHVYLLASLDRREDLANLETPSQLEESGMGRYGLILHAGMAGDRTKVAELVDEAMVSNAERDPECGLWLAEAFALVGMEDEALRWLELSVERGELDFPYLSELDPFLESLRGTARFALLMQRLEAKWQEVSPAIAGVAG